MDNSICCPFCAETIKEGAILCIHCRQNITIPQPLIDKNKKLLEQNERLTAALSQLRYELSQLRTSQGFGAAINWKKEALFLACYVGAPVVLLLIAFAFLLLVTAGRFLSAPWILIAFPFGYQMLRNGGYTAGRAILAGVLTGLAVDILGSAIVLAIYRVHLLPQTPAEWLDFVVTLVTITLAFLSGNLVADFVRRLQSRPDADKLDGGSMIVALLDRSSGVLGSVDKAIRGLLIVLTSAGAVYLQVVQLVTSLRGG
jgi:hypothetical protein